MNILDDIPDADDERASRKLARLRSQLAEVQRECKELERERDVAERIATVALAAGKHKIAAHKPARAVKGQRRAEATIVLSDLHYGKRIDAEEVGGINSYTPAIARERMASLLDGFAWQLESWRGTPGYAIERVNVALLGDMIENTLHEENHASNTMTPTEEVLFALDEIGAFVERVKGLCKSVRAVCIVGNHGRTTRKQPSSGRTSHSHESVLYQSLRKHIGGVEWVIPAAAEVIVPSYGYDIRYIHGDQIRAGNAAGGPAATISRSVMKLDSERRCHSTVMGHWHQFLFSQRPGYIVNNSLCGYDGYAKNMLLAPSSPPAQVAFLVDERDGVVMPKQIRVYDGDQRRRDAATR